MVVRKAWYKLGRRLGSVVHRKCQTQKFAANESKKKRMTRRRGAISDYGRQLLEKQKVRFTYGITEKQLRRYVKESMKFADTNAALHRKLELRLDSVVNNAGFAPTQPAARQMVSHGHITVNGRKVTIPSYIVKKGDVVAVREQSKSKTLFTQRMDEIQSANTPAWLKVDASKLSATVSSLPEYDPANSVFDFKSVFEFYTR